MWCIWNTGCAVAQMSCVVEKERWLFEKRFEGKGCGFSFWCALLYPVTCDLRQILCFSCFGYFFLLFVLRYSLFVIRSSLSSFLPLLCFSILLSDLHNLSWCQFTFSYFECMLKRPTHQKADATPLIPPPLDPEQPILHNDTQIEIRYGLDTYDLTVDRSQGVERLKVLVLQRKALCLVERNNDGATNSDTNHGPTTTSNSGDGRGSGGGDSISGRGGSGLGMSTLVRPSSLHLLHDWQPLVSMRGFCMLKS